MNLYNTQRLRMLAHFGDLGAVYEIERLDLRSGVAHLQCWPDSEAMLVDVAYGDGILGDSEGEGYGDGISGTLDGGGFSRGGVRDGIGDGSLWEGSGNGNGNGKGDVYGYQKTQ